MHAFFKAYIDVCVEFLSLVSSCILFTGLSRRVVAIGGRFCCWDLGALSLDVASKEVFMGGIRYISKLCDWSVVCAHTNLWFETR